MQVTSFNSIADIAGLLGTHQYIADVGLSTSLFLALKMGKALLLEGEPGVGKTEVAKVLSVAFGAPLIRLQCYEGIDISQAVYEWNYPRQLLEIQARQLHAPLTEKPSTDDLYSEAFLLRRPLLQAIDHSHTQSPVLLIDELDRADEEFEAFLLELLSDWQISIPELGTLRAAQPPTVILTSNRTREVHDALKRRCLFYWIDYPSLDKERQIVAAKVPGASERLSREVVAFVQELRKLDLYKLPGVAETLDWAEALVALDAQALSIGAVDDTLGAILKYQDDINQVRTGALTSLIEKATR